MTRLHRLLYCSRNSLGGEPETYRDEVRQILAPSRTNNTRAGLTGGPPFSDGCFAQVPEGPLKMVEATFERIQCDPRHHEVTVLQSGPVAARDFPDWSMAFTGVRAADHSVADVALSKAFSGASSAGKRLLRLMKQVVVREDEWLAPA